MVTNTIVRQTKKIQEKATQNVKAELITRRRAYATLALKINNLHQIDKPEHFFELGEKILKVVIGNL